MAGVSKVKVMIFEIQLNANGKFYQTFDTLP